MTLYATSELISAIAITVIGAILFIGGCLVCDKTYHFDLLGAIIAGIGGCVGAIAAICVAIFLIGATMQRNSEPVNYQENLKLQESLQQAIDSSEDIVNTELYLKAADFNSDLAAAQAAQNDPRYSMSFSGEVDWSTIPFIELN